MSQPPQPGSSDAPGDHVDQVHRDIVVIGASAGGVEALSRLIPLLPSEFPAAVFVVLHLSATGTSVLPDILTRRGPLPATVPGDGEGIERGHIFVAPPNRHMLISGSSVILSGGPRENGHRPAIDPLFRSAARAYGPRVIAVVLSGTLDDGAAGARLVNDRGGVVLVQTSEDALFPAMPEHTAAATETVSLGVEEMSARLAKLVDQPLGLDWEQRADAHDRAERQALSADEAARGGDPAELSCPECGGPLGERGEAGVVHFACRVGHSYSPESLISQQREGLERALWTATRGLYEQADLYRRLARRARANENLAARFEQRARSAEEHAEAVRTSVERPVAAADAEDARDGG